MVRRPALVLGTLWVGGAVFATSVGLVAVQRVGNEVGGPVSSPLTADAVHQALVAASPAAEHQEPETSESPEELGPVETVSTRGGVVGARCRDHEPALLYATPTDGYRTVRAGTGLVRFVGSRTQVVVRLSCADEDLLAHTTVQGSSTPVAPPAPTPSQVQSEHADSPASDAPEPSGSSSSASSPSSPEPGSEDH